MDPSELLKAINNPRPSYNWSTTERSGSDNRDKEVPDKKIPGWLKFLIASDLGANTADLITTNQAINRGDLKEGNPFMRSGVMKYGLKPAYSLGTAAYATKLAKRGNRGKAALVAGIPALIAGLATVNNIKQMRK